MKNYFIALICLGLITACSPESTKLEETGVGYNRWDGPTAVIGDQSSVDLWMNCMELHNDKDFAGIEAITAEDFHLWADGFEYANKTAYMAGMEAWLTETEVTWDPVWCIAVRNAGEPDGPQYVLSSHDIIQSYGDSSYTRNDMVLIQINDDLISRIWVHPRNFSPAELASMNE
jgi:hypothetical protein